jgi:uncharacterized protein
MNIGVVVKVSKLCNLRCTYCCEGADLANRARMSVAQIETMFCHLNDFLAVAGNQAEHHTITFFWHGGEPFAQPIGYWTTILESQELVFGAARRWIKIVNTIQSNLTLITPKHLPLLKHFRVGFSFDVINDLRTFANGRESATRVIETIGWLRQAGVPLAGIVVVSKANVERPYDTAAFYLEQDLPVRFIHLDEGLEHLPKIHSVRINFAEYLKFVFALYENPAVQGALKRGLRVDPISLALQWLAQSRARPARKVTFSDCALQEHLLEVDTDGSVYSTADYPYRNSYGNIFSDSVASLLVSDGRQRRVERSRERLTAVCQDCELFRRSCNGTWVAHATNEHYEEFRRQGGCEIRMVVQRISRGDGAGNTEEDRHSCQISTFSTM